MNSIFVVGTDTDIGKTYVSAGLVYLLNKKKVQTSYFKPFASGGYGDFQFVKSIAGLSEELLDMSTYVFETPVSPHLAKEIENRSVNLEKVSETYLKKKVENQFLVVEGAGGIIVPLIRNEYYLKDLVKDFNSPVVLVASTKVGTINHTALTYEYLKSQNIDIAGIIFNNFTNTRAENDNIKVILELTKLKHLGTLDKVCESTFSDSFVEATRKNFEANLNIDSLIK